METFTELKALVENSRYREKRQKALEGITDTKIDEPIRGLINDLNALPHCFTQQSCYGHFVYNGRNDFYNLESLSVTENIESVEYRIAYIAFCLENSDFGRRLRDTLKAITAVDPENIQFGCAEWFWERQVNSYVLQVEPEWFKYKDRAILGYQEALHIEQIRNHFFYQLFDLLKEKS